MDEIQFTTRVVLIQTVQQEKRGAAGLVWLHGLRHGYAQDRMAELTRLGLSSKHRLLIVSQELGHFRPEIVTTYLR